MSDDNFSTAIIPVPENDDNTNLLTVDDIGPDTEWVDIVNTIVETIQKGDTPDEVVEAAEFMIAGWPTYKIAKRLNVSSKTIRRWLTRYPHMAAAVAQGRKLLSSWRMARLEQQFLSAVERSQEVLDVALDDRDVNPKVMGLVAQHSRFVLGLFAGQQIDINVRIEENSPVLKAKRDALAFLASELVKQREGAEDEPIEAVYRVIDEKEEVGPLLDEKGDPLFGVLGEIDVNEEGALCHVCGERSKAFSLHVRKKHNISDEAYEVTFLLERGAVSGARSS
jgi:hypothetical protein